MQQQKLEDIKRSREDEIQYLESLSYRNPKIEERLKALILERDFQRRAEEHVENGEDDDEQEDEDENILDRADQRERLLSVQQDIERTRLRRMEQRYGAGNDVPANRLSKTLEEQEERLKLLKLEEEATHQAEVSLIQGAKKRQVSFCSFNFDS